MVEGLGVGVGNTDEDGVEEFVVVFEEFAVILGVMLFKLFTIGVVGYNADTFTDAAIVKLN